MLVIRFVQNDVTYEVRLHMSVIGFVQNDVTYHVRLQCPSFASFRMT
jgi:hypothetical protein